MNLVNSQGKPRTNRQTMSELYFDCELQSLGKNPKYLFSPQTKISFISVCLPDSILAFHEHGMQGRSLKDNEVTQEVFDQTRSFRVIGNDR